LTDVPNKPETPQDLDASVINRLQDLRHLDRGIQLIDIVEDQTTLTKDILSDEQLVTHFLQAEKEQDIEIIEDEDEDEDGVVKTPPPPPSIPNLHKICDDLRQFARCHGYERAKEVHLWTSRLQKFARQVETRSQRQALITRWLLR